MSREVLGAKVAGFCPMGCGETLFTGSGGHVTCSYFQCPNPCAVDELLAERETEHIVVFGPEGFDIQHPLRERIGGELFKCGLHQFCANLDGPPVKTGRYRAVKRARAERGWIFTPLPDADHTKARAA